MKILLSVKRINKGFPLLDDDQEINNYDVGQEETFDLIIRKLSEQPTAYDVDKVVEQLEEEREYSYANFTEYVNEKSPCLDDEYDDCFHRGLERAIKIVKRGGVND